MGFSKTIQIRRFESKFVKNPNFDFWVFNLHSKLKKPQSWVLTLQLYLFVNQSPPRIKPHNLKETCRTFECESLQIQEVQGLVHKKHACGVRTFHNNTCSNKLWATRYLWENRQITQHKLRMETQRVRFEMFLFLFSIKDRGKKKREREREYRVRSATTKEVLNQITQHAKEIFYFLYCEYLSIPHTKAKPKQVIIQRRIIQELPSIYTPESLTETPLYKENKYIIIMRPAPCSYLHDYPHSP